MRRSFAWRLLFKGSSGARRERRWSWISCLLLMMRTWRSCLLIMMILHRMSLSLLHTRHGLMRMLELLLFLLLEWRTGFRLILLSLILHISCGPFFVSAMSPLVSLPFLQSFVKSSLFDRVMVQLMTSMLRFLLFGARLTLLVLSCQLALSVLPGSATDP